jgi:LAO/AO transport system kinase
MARRGDGTRPMQLVDRLLAGEVRALARAISLVEEHADRAVEILQAIYPRTGRAAVLGVTGAPGSGKSSLVDRLVGVYRNGGHRVGVVAVDPSSAFSGGAILGDRVRMQSHATDPDVFIRSMATRGHLGGLARATNDAIDLLDAAGYDPILVETVGVGQDEVDIVKTADAVAVVLVPGMGDDIQAIKAGILEIADLFVINKADRDGVERLQADLDYVLSLSSSQDRPRPTVHRTVAVRNEGIAELKGGIGDFLESTGERRRGERRQERAEARFLALLEEELVGRVREQVFSGESYRSLVERIADRRVDPYTAVREIVERLEVR